MQCTCSYQVGDDEYCCLYLVLLLYLVSHNQCGIRVQLHLVRLVRMMNIAT